MPRPAKYPFARYAPRGPEYGRALITEATQADGGLVAVERMQSAAHTYAKRNGLVCKTAKTIIEGLEHDLSDWVVRSAIQFADRAEDQAGEYEWEPCFSTLTAARSSHDRDVATRESATLRLKVCPNCLATYNPHPPAQPRPPHLPPDEPPGHLCGWCEGCKESWCTGCRYSIGIDLPDAVEIHPHPTGARPIPPPSAPADEAHDSERDVP